MRRLVEKAEELCRLVAPEVFCAGANSYPLYLMLASDLPASFAGVRELGGVTGRTLDLVLQSLLERQNRWRGRGCAMIICPARIANDRKHRSREHRERTVVDEILAVALHELAHILNPYFLDAIDDGEQPSPARVVFQRLVLEQIAPTPPEPGGFDLGGHNWQYIRTALHLASSARTVGVDVADVSVFDAGAYGLSPTFRYTSALGNEPERLGRCGFRGIWDEPPPREFASLWRKDLLRRLRLVRGNKELRQKLADVGGQRIYIPKKDETRC